MREYFYNADTRKEAIYLFHIPLSFGKLLILY